MSNCFFSKTKSFIILTALFLCLPILFGCVSEVTSDSYYSSLDSTVSSKEENNPQPDVSIARVMAVGDNLIHNVIYQQAQKRATSEKKYDFSYVYEEIKPMIQKADVAFINQETVLASRYFEPSNFPRFCTPEEMGDCLLDVGFNVFNHANNHTLDKGQKGIQGTLEYWDTKTDEDICVIGMYKDDTDLYSCKYIEKNGIKIGFFAITEHTNGIGVPKDMTERVIYTTQEDIIKRCIDIMKRECDAVIVSVHWGNENYSERTVTPLTDAQKNFSQKLADWGVDVIIGTHPHVIQPMKWINRADGGRTFCVYSLGNFVSAMNGPCNMLGGLVDFDIVKNNTSSEITIENITYLPLVTHYGRGMSGVKVYPLKNYTDQLASSHGVKYKTYSGFSLEYLNKVVTDNIEEEYLIEK